MIICACATEDYDPDLMLCAIAFYCCYDLYDLNLYRKEIL